MKDKKFPRNKCGANVYFELVREVPEINKDYDFKVRLFEIPVSGT